MISFYKFKFVFISLAVILFLSCEKQKTEADNLTTLSAWMTGSFSSAAQATSDSSFFDIRLEMCPIWPEKAGEHWLYVEQAAAAYLDRPYRQRVYRLVEQSDGVIRSEVYAIDNPLRFAGAWKTPEMFAGLTPDSLLERDGCAVLLERLNSHTFSGSTVEDHCGSTHRGATYATSEVTITPEQVISWDRGFNKEDEQVWGAVKGGYIFQKQTDAVATKEQNSSEN